jgi:hypothetical protein
MRVFVLALLVAFLTRSSHADCLSGDLNCDCIVDMKDLVLFSVEWLSGADSHANLNGDSDVDTGDFAVLASNWNKQGIQIIINEIHSNPDVKTDLVEFVELHNPGPTDVDISRWYFSSGISYTFPMNTKLAAGAFLIVAQNPQEIFDKWGSIAVPPSLVFGPFIGRLSNEGENIELCNAAGQVVDQVDYQLGFPWPTVGDSMLGYSKGTGPSMQLVNPLIDNDLGGSWKGGYPTPAREDFAVLMDNTPPHIRQVKHQPRQPKPGQTVTITAKITDSDGVAIVTLSYQPVASPVEVDEELRHLFRVLARG